MTMTKMDHKIWMLPPIIFEKIKNEARNWALAGAKHMSSIMLGE